MEKNVGEVNAGIRVIAGIILCMALLYAPLLQYVVLIGVLATYCIVTGIIQFCPICKFLSDAFKKYLPRSTT
ncbi:MAG: DUF2892 domain-containing protein [Candidatus Hydrothermarchaeales archaeon]